MSQGAVLEVDYRPSLLERLGVVFLLLLASHFVVDALATLLPSSLGLIEVRSGLSHAQAAWLLGLGSFTSGLAQPLCALISDRLRTRVLTVVGIAVAGIGFAMLGLTTNAIALSTIYVLGMIGVGIFHPIAATTVAQLHYHRRNSATGIFFVAGMIGGVFGAILWPRWLSTSGGFGNLPLMVAPILILAFFLHRKLLVLPPIKQHQWHTADLSLLRQLGEHHRVVRCLCYAVLHKYLARIFVRTLDRASDFSRTCLYECRSSGKAGGTDRGESQRLYDSRYGDRWPHGRHFRGTGP